MTSIAISSAKGVINETGDLVYVMNFQSQAPIAKEKVVNDLQEVLYDDIGSIGCFRIAPNRRQDLNAQWVAGAQPKQGDLEFMPSKDNEVYVAFMVRGDDSEYAVGKELPIIATELADFCAQTDLRCQQVDVRDLYS